MLAEELRKITRNIKEYDELESLKRKMFDCATKGKMTTGFFDIYECCPLSFESGNLWNWLKSEGIYVSGSYREYELRWE